jgi:hypothetical protein
MQAQEIAALVALLQATWPAGDFVDEGGDLTSRGLVFGDELGAWKFADGHVAVKRLVRSFHGQFGPTVADVVDELEVARRERQQTDLPALAASSVWTDEDKAAAREAAERAFAGWRSIHGAQPKTLDEELTERPQRSWPTPEEMRKRRDEAIERLNELIAEEAHA